MTREEVHTALQENARERASVRPEVHADVLAGRDGTPAQYRMRSLLSRVDR